ncbi:hypothetical protein DFH09DRAFT_1419656 [Mycena vulgaris]|nr:hypothetical protein DFH09DRAFT_1419656 [Mycena vulgaris]
MSPILSLPNELFEEIVAVGQAEERLELEQAALSLVASLLQCRTQLRMDSVPCFGSLPRGHYRNLQVVPRALAGCKVWVTARDGHLIADHLSQIISHSSRIWRLVLDSRANSVPAMLEAFRDVSIPALEHLEIQVDDTVDNKFSLETFSAGPPIALTLSQNQRLSSLTHLDLWRAWGPDSDRSFFMAIPTRCPSLVHLCIDMICFPNSPNLARMSIPSLQSLHLVVYDDHNDDHLVEVIGLFDTPALTDLTIGFVYGDQISNLGTGVATVAPSWDSHDLRRKRDQAVPKLRLSAPVFYQKYWDENGVDVELFDPAELVRGLN